MQKVQKFAENWLLVHGKPKNVSASEEDVFGPFYTYGPKIEVLIGHNWSIALERVINLLNSTMI